MAAERRATAVESRARIRVWKHKTFGSMEALALFFAAGAIWGFAGGRDHPEKSDSQKRRTKSALAGVVNSSLLAWRLLNRADVGDADGGPGPDQH